MRVSYTEGLGVSYNGVKKIISDSAQQKDHLTDKERELQLFDPSYSNSASGPPNDATFETIKDATLVTKEING